MFRQALAVVLEGQLDEKLRHRHLGRLAIQIVRRDAARLARHPREVEPAAAGRDRLVRLAEAAGPEAAQAVEDGVAEELHSVAGEEERDLVALLERGLRDQEPERRARRVLRAMCDVHEQLPHGADSTILACA